MYLVMHTKFLLPIERSVTKNVTLYIKGVTKNVTLSKDLNRLFYKVIYETRRFVLCFV